MVKHLLWIGVLLTTGFLTSNSVLADRIFLKESEQGNEAEVLEETRDSFVLRIPKGEFVRIERARPTEMEQWRQRRILWEDTGDYLTLYLPKERIKWKGDELLIQKEFYKGLKDVGAANIKKEIGSEENVYSKVVGRVTRGEFSVEGCKLKLASIDSKQSFLGKAKKKGPIILEVISDHEGFFEFENVPEGQFDVYVYPPGAEQWLRRLSEKPNLMVVSGQTIQYDVSLPIAKE